VKEFESFEDCRVPFCIKCQNSQTYLIQCKYNLKYNNDDDDENGAVSL